MKNTEKAKALKLIDELLNMFQIENKPKVIIESTNCDGYYEAVENVICIKPKSFENVDIHDTIAHEIAHWLQYQLKGATKCFGTVINDLSREHAKLTEDIRGIMGTYMYTQELRWMREKIWARCA